jgi:peptidoglycan lytic transglycosylase
MKLARPIIRLTVAVILGQTFSCATPLTHGTNAPPSGQPLKTQPEEQAQGISVPKTDSGLATPDEFYSYFDSIQGGEAAEALATNNLEVALTLFDEIASQTSDIVLTPRARFVAAYLAANLGDDERALAQLPALAEELPLVADIAREKAACAALHLRKFERALDLAAVISESGTLGADAVLIRGDTLRAMERFGEAIETYEKYLLKWPGDTREKEAEARIVECGAKISPTSANVEKASKDGLKYLRRLQAQSPTNRWTRIAGKHEATLLDRLGLKQKRAKRESPAALKAYDRAAELKRKMRSSEANRIYSQVIRIARRGGDLHCLARFEQAIVVGRSRAHERTADLFSHVASDCHAPNLRVRALYRAAKAYTSAGMLKEAIEMFNKVETDFSDHSYADDARLRAARCQLELGSRTKFVEMLASLPDLYPAGDMRAEALWTLAHDALRQNELVEAREVLTRYYNLFPSEDGWYAAGRSGYWLARVEELLGDTSAATAHYESTIAGSPLTYYMVLAYGRLAALDEKRARQLIEELAPQSNTVQASFPKTLVDDFPALATGIELLRLGFTTRARVEFDRFVTRPDLPAEAHWVAAEMLRRAGQFAQARETASRSDNGWKKRYPTGQDQISWTAAYPTVYEDEVDHAANQSDVPHELIWAVMREESGFNEKIESWANAIGLMQLILPTARSMGKKLGIKANRQTLRNPKVNIALGTAYLGYLQDLFSRHPALVIAGYNAGEGAVRRWRKENKSMEIDTFVEEIPYDQTRGYTKRVIATYATYTFLYGNDHSIVEIDFTIP